VKPLPVVLPVAALLALACIASAQEWTRFRGPNGSGIGQAKLPDQITEKDFVWKTALPGKGHSSPVVWGDRVFVTANPDGTGKRVLACLSAADGKIAWQREYDTAPYFHLHADNNYASATPAVDAERVYVTWMSPESSGIAALDQKDGRELWKKDLGPFQSQHGPGTSPMVHDGTVYLDFDPDAPGSFLVAFDAKTGAERWRWKHEGTSHSSITPCVFTPRSGAPQIITMSRTVGLTALDPKNGAIAWQMPGIFTKRCVASPIVAGDLVIGQCGEGQAESFVEVVRPAADGKSAVKAYEVIRTGGYVPTPIVVGDSLYLWKENGDVTKLRAADNQQVWSKHLQGPFYGSPIAIGDRLYNVTRRGELVIISAGDTFQEVARVSLGEGSFATPAVSGGRMFVRTFSQLIAIGGK
jgi:outer membrane protein assembly factor BamB